MKYIKKFELRTIGKMNNNIPTDFKFAINVKNSSDEEKLEILSKKIGFEFSKKRDAINNQRSNNTIIIKEEPRRPGVNINIGR